MSRLKTLKEIDFGTYHYEDGDPISKVKQEAIKHVKQILKEDNHKHHALCCSYCATFLPQVKWIVDFFNLTDEDFE